MATKKGGKCKRYYYQAKLVTNVGTCVFCRRAVDDEIIYGKLYAIGDIQCHYFCALLSCCLMQKGSDEEGLFGFLYPDILAEVERSKKHRCSYCSREGASLGCSVAQCRKQFHLPCGRERDAVSLFFGNYKSFCALHAPKQKIVDSIMPNVKMRIAEQKQKLARRSQKAVSMNLGDNCGDVKQEVLCAICYEQVEGFPTPKTFWPPCCARDAWFHRSCLQRMALSAGMHYLKCPLCNDKDEFYKAVVSQGYYVPDRDAAWELEQNAFAEIYERPVACSAETCKCTKGRDYDSDSGPWDIKLCILCGSTAIHAGCTDSTDEQTNIYICAICKPAAPCDLEKLIASIEKVQLQEPSTEQVRHGPVMPSRMSIRRTKPLNNSRPCSSRNLIRTESMTSSNDTKTEASRLELNLKKPIRRIFEQTGKSTENILLSPLKMLEQGFSEKMGQLNNDVVVDSSKVLEKLRDKLKKPRPLVAKKRIINNILDELFTSILHDPKSKEALKEWNSPKKTCDITAQEEKEIIEDVTPAKTIKEENPLNDKDTPKSKPVKAISLQYINIANEKDVCELNEFKCSFKHRHIDKTLDGSKLRTAIDFAIDAHKENKRKMPYEETIPLKKRKINCSLKREKRDSVEKNVLETEKDDLDGEKVSTEFRKQDETKEVKEEFKKDGDTEHNKIIVADTVLKDTVPKHKGIVVSYNLTRKKSVEKETKIETEGSETESSERNNKEHEGTIKSTDVAEVREEIEKNNIEIDKRSIVDEESNPKDSVSKKKNLGLKKRSAKKVVKKAIDLKSKNKSVFTDAKSAKIEDLNELKEDVAECNKDILKDRKAEDLQDKGKEKNRRKERKHSSKIKKNNDRRHKRTNKEKHEINDLKSDKDGLDFTLDDSNKKLKLKYENKHKKMSIQNRNIKVKIKWKKEHFKLKITGKKEKKEKKKRRLNTPKVFKQYILKYSPEVTSPKEIIMKPTNDVTPAKRKYIKMEKHVDNMIQTNINSFFKATPKAN